MQRSLLATESVNLPPFKKGETKAQIFGKESAKLIVNFSATKVTSLPSASLSHTHTHTELFFGNEKCEVSAIN